MIPLVYTSAVVAEGEELIDYPRPFVFLWTYDKGATTKIVSYGCLVNVAAETSPYVNIYAQYFDAISGTFLRQKQLTSIDFLTMTNYSQSRDGTLWLKSSVAGGEFYAYNPDNWERTGDQIDYLDFTPQLEFPVAIDLERQLVLSCTQAATAVGVLSVYDRTTMERLRTVRIGSAGRQILLEDDRRAYVVCDDGVLVLVDYVEGRILGTFRVAYAEDVADPVEKRLAWDPYYRRLIVAGYVQEPVMRGYYPTPMAVALTPAIPLQVARAGRTVRFATRAYGDAGEGIAGKSVTVEVGPGAEPRSATVVTGHRGYAFHAVDCEVATEEVDIAAECEQ